MGFLNSVSRMIDPYVVGVIGLTVAFASLFGASLISLIEIISLAKKAESHGWKWLLHFGVLVSLIFMLLSCTGMVYMAPHVAEVIADPTPASTPTPEPTSPPLLTATPQLPLPNCYPTPGIFPCFVIASPGDSVCKIVAEVHGSTVEDTKDICVKTCQLPDNQEFLEQRFGQLPDHSRRRWEDPCNLIHPGEKIIIPE